MSKPNHHTRFAHRRAAWLALLLAALLLPGLASAQKAPAKAGNDEPVVLNFKEADLQAVIALVSEQTGTNFVVDPRVRGKVTIVSSKPVSKDDLYQIFLSVLKIHGFAAVPGIGAVKLVPEALAKQGEVPTVSRRGQARGDEYITRIINVEHIDAAQLVPILRPLIPQGGHLAAATESNILIVSDTAANVQRLLEIVAQIDKAGSDELEVIRLEHASAAEVVRILTALDGAEAAKGTTRASRLQLTADERTNSILVGGDPKRRLRVRAVVAHLDTPMPGGENTQVIYLRYADAKELADVLKGLSGTLVETATGGQGAATTAKTAQVHIQPHESTNALVINAPPDILRTLQSVIRQLDVRRAQVLVEAVIAEVSTDRATELGVQWAFGSEDSGIGIINFDRGNSGIVSMAAGINSFLEGGSATPPTVGNGISLGLASLSGSFKIAALIRALRGDTHSNILSTPTLLTMDNEEAEIIVGQNVPFITSRSVEQSGQAFNNVQRQDVGLKLKVKPQINEGNAVKLDIEQEVSAIVQTVQSSIQPTDIVTNKRSLKTSVMVEDGEMIVLGGLIDEALTQTADRVPGLGDIPGLGRLFRYDGARKEKRNLMIFLHPVIVRDQAVQADITASKYNFIRGEQQRAREKGVLMMPKGTAPMLPEMEAILRLPPPYPADPSTSLREQPANDGPRP
ncbi:MAG: type II secretion system secretin GspD [Chromatiales bacterium]|jgi:general secretion pathway protein D|nr:type II secretion system secretin GspD [Chromatiales bacterium]MDX9766679.1 type II secretion system secretin GspD [Ectothiorhodospiraceae bacterium]